MSDRPLRIGIDLRFTAASHMGTGRYAEQTALDLAEARHPGDMLIGFTDGDPFSGALADSVSYRRVPRVAGADPTGITQRLLWDSAIAQERLDVFLAPTALAPAVRTSPTVITVHDLHFERHPEWFEPGLREHLVGEIRRSVAAADAIIAISEWTKRDAVALYQVPTDRIHVLHQGLDRRFGERPSAPAIETTLRELGVQPPYLLVLSNHAPHKNTEFAIALFAQWIQKTGDTAHRLVLAGGGPAPKQPVDLGEVVTRHGLGQRVLTLGRVADAHLPSLYAGAALFLFPSLAEGWGLPPLEAIAMGTPALVANTGAMPEAIGAAGRCLPLDHLTPWLDAVSEAVRHGVNDDLRAAMTQRTQEVLAPTGARLRRLLAEVAESPRLPATAAVTTRSRPVTGAPPSAATSPPRPRLSGCMIIKNGVRLGYPFVEAIHAVIDHVDEMVVVDGASEDGTWDVLQGMASTCNTLRIERAPWPATTTGGRVIAEATNDALARCRGSHVLVIQADEIHTERNLVRLRALLQDGFDCAAMPFLHFRSSWWTILANPAYNATIRCVPNRPGVASVDDGTTFRGPLGRCAPPDAFPDPIFHVGWVYATNIIAKHCNHATIYADHADYQEKAERARRTTGSRPEDVALIDGEYQLLRFQGRHPAVITHLLEQAAYDPAPGLSRWQQRNERPGRTATPSALPAVIASAATAMAAGGSR